MSTLRDMNASSIGGTTHADALRETMIGELREMGTIRSDQVAEAFRAVPRHLFAPGAPLEAVYAATTSVVTKRDDHGVPISSVSAPELQAFMLEQAAIILAHHVIFHWNRIGLPYRTQSILAHAAKTVILNSESLSEQ